ncbi:hypothetical protein E3T61_03070 [Cryobacterium lactosi]|uniref:Uncharacterized protein n=1 Tax=Cryobacterium lactosi TaxID=1259202 RepID=A0A4R9C0L0_9MICO|nr:hypothetical protein [Cryobacterium lactosi]TFD93995.1 hypothetical protein E3T61_03070 [Cryobacterium lactosi]
MKNIDSSAASGIYAVTDSECTAVIDVGAERNAAVATHRGCRESSRGTVGKQNNVARTASEASRGTS